MKVLKKIFFLLLFTPLVVACDNNDSDDDDQPVKHDVVIRFQPQFNGASITNWENADLRDGLGRKIDLQTMKYYLSDIRFLEGITSKSVLEAELIDHRTDPLTGTFDNLAEVKALRGDYTALQFNLGLTDDLNGIDPATYATESPLSAMHGMYWDWATKYIFTKTEGRIDANNDETAEQSWFIHTGLNELLRSDITVTRSFSIPEDDTINVYVNLNNLFVYQGDTSDLVNNGQSHTMDNMELAVDFSDRIANAFQ